MRNYIILMLLFVTSFSYAAPVTIDQSMLTSQQIAQLKADSVNNTNIQTLETVSKYAGVGKEIGIAIKDGLTAVVDVSEKFGKTKVGEFTMYIIAWKLLGKDFLRIILGIIFLIVVTYIIWNFYMSITPHKVLIEGSFWKPWQDRKYEMYEPKDFDGIVLVRWLMILCEVLTFVITFNIMFE